jgi:2,3-bisphosphoglycerate-independent phosphoglycerate mutase
MSAIEVTDVLIKKVEENIYDVIIINFANPDMVAHTGVIEATIKAMEITDECIGKIYRAIKDKGGAMIISSDHGNAEEMIDLQTGNIDTKHSTNPVPLLVLKNGLESREIPFGILADVVPTALALLGIPKPVEMTGRDLLV